MASSISNHSVSSYARARIGVIPSPALRLLAASVSFRRNPSLCSLKKFSGLSSESHGRRFPMASEKVSVSNAETVSLNEEEDQLQGADSSEKNIKFLIQAYKEAILNDDEESLARVELEIRSMEISIDALTSKVNELTTEIAAGKDQFLRMTADFENFRKRSEKDRNSFKSNIQRDLIEGLLPIVDSFEGAKRKMNPETDKEKKLDASYQGIYKQLVEILRSLRVSVVQTVGTKFDPLIHEAVGRVESEKFKEGVVVEEISRGFFLGDQVVRLAKVRVSAGASGGGAPVEQKPAGEVAVGGRDDSSLSQ